MYGEVSSYKAKFNKKIPVFRVAQPNLNLLVKPRIFLRFSEKNIILCILKGKMPFKMHKIIFFSRKKIYVRTLPKSFRPITQNTLIFLFGLIHLKALTFCMLCNF